MLSGFVTGNKIRLKIWEEKSWNRKQPNEPAAFLATTCTLYMYKEIWEAAVGKILVRQRELRNAVAKYMYTVAVTKDGLTARHLIPTKVSYVCSILLHRGEIIWCRVTGYSPRHYRSLWNMFRVLNFCGSHNSWKSFHNKNSRYTVWWEERHAQRTSEREQDSKQ